MDEKRTLDVPSLKLRPEVVRKIERADETEYRFRVVRKLAASDEFDCEIVSARNGK